ncbi:MULTISPECIES: type VI secretion system tube protein TssD [Bacteroidales]|uniref:Thioesterase domain-containing protein n=1 Tax=Tannerella forsythia TaxID=28112 RepID=A0A3P1XFG4_TANFO|nr:MULTISPECIES: type VI secretion system tube protein TssD [Bacteroidales]RRD56690.1 hypothetical protein EII40_13575 [Tannerella forsythia]
MSIRAVLCINKREYRVLRYRQRFARRVSSNGMPASDLYGGTIDVEFESERDSGIFALMTDENTPTIEGYLRISPSEEDTMVRELKFDEAYLVGYSEQQYDDWGAPVTMCVSISPIRLDFNRTVCIERRNSSIWREYRAEKPLFKAPVHTPPSPLVTSVKGEETALPTHTVKYSVTGYNLATIGANDRERVKWLVRVDGRDEQPSQRGETLELMIKPEWTGKDVTVMPYLRKPNEEVSVKTTVKRKIILFFIGGAGDKKPFLSQGPTYIMKSVMNYFNRKIEVYSKAIKNESYYLGYDELYPEKDIKDNILSKINSSNTPIYIIGHSFGGWNAAHLSKRLKAKGHKIKMLITLDPVSGINGVEFFADLYHEIPIPTSADFWINISAVPEDYKIDDLIADVGGQWKPKIHKPNIYFETKKSHGQALEMFTERIVNGMSAFDFLISSILKNE